MEMKSNSQSIPARDASKGAIQALRRPARVLIGEDDWVFRDMLLWAFEEDGCEVVTVGDGGSLLEVIATSLLPKSALKPFDLVVSDVRMPGWNGLAALENLSRSPLVPPVVVITAFGSDEIHDRAERAGVVAVLDKPFDITELTALSRRMISQHAA
jgi:CheY-like chemotaxis protein